MDTPNGRAIKPVKSTILDGMHTGRNWLAVLSCGDRLKYDRRPTIGRVVACPACTRTFDLTPERVSDLYQRMEHLATMTRSRARQAAGLVP